MLKLRRALLFCCVWIAAFAVGAEAQILPKVRAAYTSISIQFTPVYIMKELNLPRKHGLDTEVLFVPVSSRAVQAALAGEIHFLTSGGVANINANQTGADFTGLTATLNTFVFKIYSHPDIKRPEHLKGKKVGISRLGGASDFSIRYALIHYGLQPDKEVAIIQVGGEPESVLALQNRIVDAAILSEPFATLAGRHGSNLLADLSLLNAPYTMHGIGVRRSYIQANRDTTLRFMRAYLESIYVFKTNKELSLNILKKYTRQDDLSLVQTSYDEMSTRLIRRVPYPSREGIQTIIDQLAKTRPEMKNLNPNDFIDPSILKEIEDSGFVKKLYGN
jgi:NitT/TauT family transport system substrate-binding protein